MKLLLILLFSLLSCAADYYTCEVTIHHIDQTFHGLPVEVVIGYESHLIPPNQSVVLTVFKNTDLDVCINSFSAKNEGHTSLIQIYSGFSYGGKLVVGKRTTFDNRYQLCAFRIYADNDCNFKVLR